MQILKKYWDKKQQQGGEQIHRLVVFIPELIIYLIIEKIYIFISESIDKFTWRWYIIYDK